ncbi:MAG: nucleoside deaminase [Actinobacteria bacterium]|jgi:tRNA(adenine34) deaminase|nr:nucleoside deaminase [Actinomycetota bacterium]
MGHQKSTSGKEVVSDRDAMELALAEARLAALEGEVPVGAVAVFAGTVLSSRHNEREHSSDPTAHAEVLAVRDAAATLGTWHLEGVDLFVTLEPCPMCAGAILLGRVRRLVYAVADPKTGACGSLYNLCDDPRMNHSIDVHQGLLADEAARLLSRFFTGIRI